MGRACVPNSCVQGLPPNASTVVLPHGHNATGLAPPPGATAAGCHPTQHATKSTWGGVQQLTNTGGLVGKMVITMRTQWLTGKNQSL